jgi:aldehyde dehydrogenase (NAD+)
MKKDLGRCKFEACSTEWAMIVGAIDETISELPKWSKPESRSTPLLCQAGSSWVQFEPKGVCLNISPWNYPISLALLPMISMIAAGNVCVLKPSEISANCAVALREICEGIDAIEVFEGGVRG